MGYPMVTSALLLARKSAKGGVFGRLYESCLRPSSLFLAAQVVDEDVDLIGDATIGECLAA